MRGWGKIKPGAKYAGVSVRTFRGWLKGGLRQLRLKTGTILIRYSWVNDFLLRYEADEDQTKQKLTTSLMKFWVSLMLEQQIIGRKIVLKKQAISLLKNEIEELRDKLNLLKMKDRFEKQLKENDFDSVLSLKLDCIQYLLEN